MQVYEPAYPQSEEKRDFDARGQARLYSPQLVPQKKRSCVRSLLLEPDMEDLA